MKRLVAAVVLAASACSPAAAPDPTSTQSSTATSTVPPVVFGTPVVPAVEAAEQLVADLVAGGTESKVGSFFLAEPLRGEGISVCVGTETVQVYVLRDHDAALAAASLIDRNDPSRVGTSIVEWSGTPRFWLRDRIIVLYVGDDAQTDTALRGLLGEPFAEGRPGRPPLPAPDCQ